MVNCCSGEALALAADGCVLANALAVAPTIAQMHAKQRILSVYAHPHPLTRSACCGTCSIHTVQPEAATVSPNAMPLTSLYMPSSVPKSAQYCTPKSSNTAQHEISHNHHYKGTRFGQVATGCKHEPTTTDSDVVPRDLPKGVESSWALFPSLLLIWCCQTVASKLSHQCCDWSQTWTKGCMSPTWSYMPH